MTTVDSGIGAYWAFEQPFTYQALLVVAAAREWAATIWTANEADPVEFMDELPTATINTEEEKTRRALLDAVHDLERHSRPVPRPADPSLFDPPA